MPGIRITPTNLSFIDKRLKITRDKYQKVAPLTAGYSAFYAIYVHEDLIARHRVGQAKFLSAAFKYGRKRVIDIIIFELKHGVTFNKALVTGMRYIMKISRQLVPVRTGNLKKSWFIQRGESIVASGPTFGADGMDDDLRETV